jgi:acetolactate synthase-1/2/3 large subunit
MPTLADTIVGTLRHAGVGFIFGMPGGGSNLDLIAAAGRAGIPFVLAATETGAALAAIAQAEVSGGPGVCLTTLGPGVTSVVNGVACAWLDRAPLLVLTDNQPASTGGLFAHQRLDHRALLASVTKWSATISPENAVALLHRAIDCATTEPRGPVHIDCPGEVAALEHHVATDESGAAAAARARHEGQPHLSDAAPLRDPDSLIPFVEHARKPLLLVGLGARRPLDAEAIAALCASHGIPAMVTYKAKGVVADTDPHFAGVFTNGTIERAILAEADLLIGVGLDPVELLPRAWSCGQPIVNVGPWPVEDRHIPFAAQLVTDVPTGMQFVGRLLPRARWDLDAVHRAFVAERQKLCPPTSSRLSAHRVVQVAADAASARARVTVDAGAHMFPATMLWPVSEPNGMLISNGLSTMGFALPAAIGAALLGREGAPGAIHDHDRPVVALTGDGGLLICAGELLTAVRERLRVITIVFSDGRLSLIDIKQQQRQLPASGVALGAVDWCRLAESLGVAAHAADDEYDLERALARALDHCGPTLIEARIDPGTYGETLRAVRGESDGGRL